VTCTARFRSLAQVAKANREKCRAITASQLPRAFLAHRSTPGQQRLQAEMKLRLPYAKIKYKKTSYKMRKLIYKITL